MNNHTRFEHIKRVAYSVGPSTAILSAGLALHARPELPWILGVEAAGALGSGWLAANHKWPFAWVFAGGFGYAALTTWYGFDLLSLLGWAGASATAFGLRLWFEHRLRHVGGEHFDNLSKRSDLNAKLMREQMTAMRLQKQIAAQGHALGNTVAGMAGALAPASVVGTTPEETSLRTAIWDVFRAELLAVLVSPSEHGYRAILALPPTLDRARLRRDWGRVRTALAGTGRYDLEDGARDNELIVRYSTASTFEDEIPYVPEIGVTMSDPIYLGPDVEGNDTRVKMLGRHTLILGTSGNGKSNIMNQLILGAVRRGCAVIGIDMKKGVELSVVAPLLVTLAKTGDEAREVFDWLDAETDRRSEIMIREGIRDWSDEFGPYIVLAIDELSELTDKKWKVDGLPNLAELNASASRIFRAFGVYLIAATQAPSSGAFGGNTDARTNYKNRISTRLEEAGHAQFGFGQSWKSRGWDPNGILEGPGEYLLSNEEYRKPIRRKSPLITDDDLRAEVSELLPFKVGLDGSPWGEGGVPLTVDTRVLNLLRNRGDVSRKEIEEGLRLDGQQVRDAIKRLRARKGIEIEFDQSDGVYRVVTEDPRAGLPLVEPP